MVGVRTTEQTNREAPPPSFSPSRSCCSLASFLTLTFACVRAESPRWCELLLLICSSFVPVTVTDGIENERFAGLNEKGERVYWINDMVEPVSMQDILTGAVELPDTFQVDTHMGDPNAAEVPRPDLVERVSAQLDKDN